MLTNKCFLACVVSVVSNMQTTNRLPAVVEHITGVGPLTPNVRSRCLLVLKKNIKNSPTLKKQPPLGVVF